MDQLQGTEPRTRMDVDDEDDEEEPSQRSPRLDDAKVHDEGMRGDEECQGQDVMEGGDDDEGKCQRRGDRKGQGPDSEEPVSKRTRSH